MDNIVISAVFTLPGGVLPAEQPCSKNGKKKKNKMNQEPNSSYENVTIKINHKESVVINLRKPKAVQQVMHMSKDAYDYMSSAENPIYGIKPKEWKNMSKKLRVKSHLLLIAHDLGGELESFTILED